MAKCITYIYIYNKTSPDKPSNGHFILDNSLGILTRIQASKMIAKTIRGQTGLLTLILLVTLFLYVWCFTVITFIFLNAVSILKNLRTVFFQPFWSPFNKV